MKEVTPTEVELLSRCREIGISIIGQDEWIALPDDAKEGFETAFLVGIRVTQEWVSERLFGPLIS